MLPSVVNTMRNRHLVWGLALLAMLSLPQSRGAEEKQQTYCLLEAYSDADPAPPYEWTSDHLQVGVRWQPFHGKPKNNAADAARPIISRDSSYAQFWCGWAAVEPTIANTNYLERPSSSLRALEQAVDICLTKGLKVEFVFFHCPAWASDSGAAGGYKPKQGFYEQFVRRIATHFKGRVHAYQLYHEANLAGLMHGADMDFFLNDILVKGGQAIREVYAAEPAEPVLVSTTGMSPCENCGTRKGLNGRGGRAVNQFYDMMIAKPELMELVDALNLNVSDNGDGYGNMDGSYVPSVWGNYELVRRKLDAAGYRAKSVRSAESWIVWDDAGSAKDVNRDGVKNEIDAYQKAITIIGQCLHRGLNTLNLPWCDNSSSWAMGLTKRRDYNGRIKTLKPEIVVPANDGGADIVMEKIALHGGDDNFIVKAGSGQIFTKEDHINPPDPNHLHYYIWKWYAQIAGGSDEVIRHAVAGEIGNDVVVTGAGFTGNERYRLASYNRTRKSFTVLIYSGGANTKMPATLKIPAQIRTGFHYNNEFSKIDFRGEGFQDGDRYQARVITKDISPTNGADIKPRQFMTAPATVTNETLIATIPRIDRFTTVEFVRLPPPPLKETLAPLKNNAAPQTLESMWAGFDPQKEPLDTEILKEWEEDGVVLRVVRYRVGVFKGEKAMVAAVYGFPKGGSKLPGLVQIHGGGQYADHMAPLLNAKRGYATVSISWAGRISAPGYRVSPNEVKLFWEGKTNAPNYKIITDWGALDAYHAPSRNGKDAFVTIRDGSEDWTLDDVESPRNSSWFLATMAARRALTFLEQQPEVAADRLGVYGHSMGGKLTVATAAVDKRVKAAAPSCGGVSDRYNTNPLHGATIGDSPALQQIACPIIFLSPANDFHGRIDDLQTALTEIRSKDWRITCSPHHNHQDTAEYEVATQLWFDEQLKGSFHNPQTPEFKLQLKTENGVPAVTIKPDTSQRVLSVDVFYTQHGQSSGEKIDHDNTKNRHWHHAKATRQGDTWMANTPILHSDKPLWVYANVQYPLPKPVTGAGYYYRPYTADKFNLSSRMLIATPEQFRTAEVKATLAPTDIIENFKPGWEKEWFTYRPEEMGLRTHKLYDDRWKAAKHANLSLTVRSAKPNKLVIGIDAFAAEIELSGNSKWETITLSATDFKDAHGVAMTDWNKIREFRFLAAEHLRSTKRGDNTRRLVGGNWQGEGPDFKLIRWLPANGR